MSTRQAANKTYVVHAACIRGVEACPVNVEVSLSGGIPGMSIVGMADAAVLEARQRIRCAMRASGYEIPRQSITVSLAPGDMRKTGSGLDLPIAIAILAVSGQISTAGLDGCLFAGELTLDGSVCGVKGDVAYQLLARNSGLDFIGGITESPIPLDGVEKGYLLSLDDMRAGIAAARRSFTPAVHEDREATGLDYGDVIGQEFAKRGIAVAAAGGLGMMMVGPPGSGKTMLARRMTSILPPIGNEELQEALCIHSVVGEPMDALLRGERPFRNPHHSTSMAGLVGGGRPVRPGEISLAHGGCLFLDELGEFGNKTLQTLRQPVEEGLVRIVRADGLYTFPARFQLLAASNPCPCGYLGDREIACRCSEHAIERYRAKLGGPLADRIDLILSVSRPDPELIVEGVEGQTTADLVEAVIRGREFRSWRESHIGQPEAGTGSRSLDSSISSFRVEAAGNDALIELARHNHLTGRGIKRLCRIARTLADMDEAEKIRTDHILEASMLQGRRGDGKI